MIDFDFHMHTTWSDGEQDIREMFNAAEVLGLKKVAVTDHFRKKDHFNLGAYASELKKLENEFPFQVFAGVELEWDADKGVSYFSCSDRALIDFCICELMGELVFLMKSKRYEAERKEKAKFMETVFNAYYRMAESPVVDVIAHPFNFGRMTLEFDFDLDSLSRRHLYEMALLMHENDIAYELQTQFFYWYPNIKVEKLLKQQIEVARIFRDAGVRFSAGSDAHNLGTVGNMRWADLVIEGLGGKVELFNPVSVTCA